MLCPGWGPRAGSGAVHPTVPQIAAAARDGRCCPAQPALPGSADQSHALSQCSPFPPSPRLPVMDPLFSQLCLLPGSLPARCGWPDPPPARPLPSWAVPWPGLAAPGHGANLLPLPAVLPGASAGGLPAPLPSLHCLRGSVFLQAGRVPQEQGARGMLLLNAPGTNAEDTRVHIQTAPCTHGDDGDPTHKGWTWMSWPVGPVHSKQLQGLMRTGWELRVGYFHGCHPVAPLIQPQHVSLYGPRVGRGEMEKPKWDVG